MDEIKKRRFLPGLDDDQVFEMFQDWCMGNSVRFMENKYRASYRVMRRVCRQKLISVFRSDLSLMEKIVEKAKTDKTFKYDWGHL